MANLVSQLLFSVQIRPYAYMTLHSALRPMRNVLFLPLGRCESAGEWRSVCSLFRYNWSQWKYICDTFIHFWRKKRQVNYILIFVFCILAFLSLPKLCSVASMLAGWLLLSTSHVDLPNSSMLFLPRAKRTFHTRLNALCNTKTSKGMSLAKNESWRTISILLKLQLAKVQDDAYFAFFSKK